MEDFVNRTYVYCTDFVINLANLSHLSYYEINTIIFCVVYPLMAVGLLLLLLIQNKRLKTFQNKINLRPSAIKELKLKKLYLCLIRETKVTEVNLWQKGKISNRGLLLID